MRTIIIFCGMLFCVFAPVTIFTLIGYRSMTALGNRPSGGGRVMVPMIIRLFGSAMGIILVLMWMLSVFLR